MPETMYTEDEVYITEERVNNAHHDFDKAAMVYDLIYRLQQNETWSRSSDVGEILSHCNKNLKPYTIYG